MKLLCYIRIIRKKLYTFMQKWPTFLVGSMILIYIRKLRQCIQKNNTKK